MEPVTATAVIANKKGLHARAAAKFVKVVNAHQADVRVQKLNAGAPEEGAAVSGTSILGLMMLSADLGSSILISATGAQAAEVAGTLKELVEGKFGEDE